MDFHFVWKEMEINGCLDQHKKKVIKLSSLLLEKVKYKNIYDDISCHKLYCRRCINHINTDCGLHRHRYECCEVLTYNTKKGAFSLSNNTQQLLRSCLKFVWKSLRVKTAREKRPVAANSLTLQKSQEEELPWHEGHGVCVVPSVARRYGGEAVSRLDGG